MRWSFKLFRVVGIDVRVHLTFLLLLVFLGLGNFAAGGLPAAIHGVAFVSLVFLCVLLHEFGHALAARTSAARRTSPPPLPV